MRKLLKISTATLAITSLVLGVVWRPASAAGTATFYLTPSSGTYTVGNTVSLQIWEDSGTDNVNTTEVVLNYPSNLTYQSEVNGSHWDIAPGTSAGGGTVTIDRAHCESPALNQPCTPLSGPSLIATVNFTAASAGSASVTFGSSTILYRTSDNQPETLTKNPGTYTINAPATPPPPTGGGSTGGSSGGSSGSTSKTSTSTSKSTTSSSSSSQPSSTTSTTSTPSAPTISSIQIKNLSDQSATITWTTSVPATSEVDYGTDTHYGFVATDSNLTTNHSVVLDPSYLVANKTYHFQIKSVDASGKVVTSKDVSFQTQLASASKPAKSNAVWEAVAVLLVLGAGAAVAVAYLKHFRLSMHHVTPVAGGVGMAGGSTPIAPHNNPIIVNPQAKIEKGAIIMPEPPSAQPDSSAKSSKSPSSKPPTTPAK